jgi:DNA repair exonuclease SbcCD ATPase subunit
VLLDWQPVLVLEKENYALREENRHLHFQVQELMAWKERALKQMLALGPKRQRANRDVQQATQLQRKLQHVEKWLLDRRALEDTNEKLHETQRGLEQRVEQLTQEVEMLQQRLSDMTTREARARAHVQGIADQFREHLEHLVAIRERLDSEADETTGQIPEDETDPVSPPINEDEEKVIEDPTVLVRFGWSDALLLSITKVYLSRTALGTRRRVDQVPAVVP